MATQSRLDENTWQVPEDWWTVIPPFRGHSRIRPIELDPGAASEGGGLLGKYSEHFREALADTAFHDTEVAAAVATVLDRPLEHHTPFAVAVTYGLLSSYAYRDQSPLADSWIAAYGNVFAAEAAVYWVGLEPSRLRSDHVIHDRIRQLPPGASQAAVRGQLMTRIRAYLAALSDSEYLAVETRLAALREELDTRWAQLATAYLIPTRQEWIDTEIHRLSSAPHQGRLEYTLGTRVFVTAAGITTLDQLTTLADAIGSDAFVYPGHGQLYYAFAARLGPECAPVLGQTMAAAHKLADKKSGDAIGDILARFPTDEAFTQLLSRIDRPYAIAPLRAAIERFPRRAMRLLAAEIPHSPTAGYLLNEHALAHPEIAAECGVQVDNRYARIAEDRLPELLRTPPWVRPRPKARPVVVTGVGTDHPPAVAWAPGERERWAATAVRELHYEGAQDRFWEELIDDARKDRGWHGHVLPGLLAAGPEHVVRPHLATANHGVLHNAGPALRRLLGRFGAAAVSFVLGAAQSKPTLLADVLLPVTGTAVTSAMIRWLDSKSVRGLALSWFDRHIDTAATDLVAAALAKPGKDRRLAEAAVRTLAERGHRAALVETARSHSDKAAVALIAVLDSDPLLQLPTRMPTLPEWLTLAALPPIVLRSGEGALPDSAVGHVCTMLALCGQAGDYSGIAQVAEFADPDSLAEFAWLVFQAWRLADYPSAHGWVLHAQGLLGNDETARRLAPLIREWPGETAHARAVNGLDVLAAIGTHEALTQLNGIAQRVKFKALKARAWERFGDVADGLGLTADELADRLVPDLGLDAAGTKVLDYGARGFIVGFDEQLKPTVSEAIRAADGHWAATTLRATLPKPGVKDDSELAPAAHKAFGVLRKEAKNLAADQLRRMEAAMVRARRWPAAEHRRLLIEHPLLWHLTRRLVWATYTADGTVTGTFRVAEDRTLADPRDNPITIPDDAPVGIAHPLDLADLLGPWGEVFADYELLQPFPQLQRETYVLTDTERASRTLTRFHDRNVRTERLLALHKYGWERGRPQDNGSSFWIHRPLGGERSAVIGITPGIYIAEPLMDDEQTINQVRITAAGEEDDEYQQLTPHIFAELDRITASEMLRELQTVFHRSLSHNDSQPVGA